MKNTLFIAITLVISGCSSTNYISTQKYSDEITQNCINSLSKELQENRDSRANCALKSNAKISLANRIYEIRASDDLKACKQSYSDQKAVEECFAKKQEAYYQGIVLQNVKK